MITCHNLDPGVRVNSSVKQFSSWIPYVFSEEGKLTGERNVTTITLLAFWCFFFFIQIFVYFVACDLQLKWSLKSQFFKCIYMTWNIIAASLKGLSKYRRMALSFLEYFRFRDTDVLICIMLIRKVMMPCAVQLKWFMNWIKKISGNSEAILVFDKKRLEQREFPWQQH